MYFKEKKNIRVSKFILTSVKIVKKEILFLDIKVGLPVPVYENGSHKNPFLDPGFKIHCIYNFCMAICFGENFIKLWFLELCIGTGSGR